MSCVCLRRVVRLELLVLGWEVIPGKSDRQTSSEHWFWLSSGRELAPTYPRRLGKQGHQQRHTAGETGGAFRLMCHLFPMNSIKHRFLLTGRIPPGSLRKLPLPPRPSCSILPELSGAPAHPSWTTEQAQVPLKYVLRSIHGTRGLSPRLASQKT